MKHHLRTAMHLARSSGLCASLAIGLFACGPNHGEGADASDISPVDAVGASEDVLDVPPCLPADGFAGAACTCDRQCNVNAVCGTEQNTGFPNGWCFQPCGGSDSVPDGALCETVQDAAVVNPACTPGDDECRSGYLCADLLPPLAWCTPVCSEDSQCSTGHCDLYTTLCQPSPTTGGTTGDPCVLESDCRSGYCYQPPLFPSGYCYSWCNLADPACPDNAICVPVGTEYGACLAACTGDAGCRADYHCSTVLGACVPPSFQ
jgi:hypothetical protein